MLDFVAAVLMATALAPGQGVGVVDPSTATWYLTVDGTETTSFVFGDPGDIPMVGDWDCDGMDTPGMYRQSDGFVYLRNSSTQGIADIRFFLGNPGDMPIVGDFNGDGCDTVSVHRPGTGEIFIINSLGRDDGGLGGAEFSYVFGNPGDQPFVGDFDGDGIDTVGLHRPSTGLVYLRNAHSQGMADTQFVFGDPDDRIVSSDWDGDGMVAPGVFRPTTGTFHLRSTNTAGNADVDLRYGLGRMLPVAGRFGDLPGGDRAPGITLPIVSRGTWGAVPADPGLVPHTIARLTIHHAGTTEGTPGPPRYRAWQQFHMSRGWPDISYHVIVGIDGTIYEGRDPAYRTDTNTGYDTAGHFQIVLEGNFEVEEPTTAQLDSLVRLLAWASLEYGVSPTTISGHGDHGATLCPGEDLARRIESGEIEEAVLALLGGR
ncbi:MAG: peptidoglycan recognition family protein [Acidimicrobiia bacterium]